MTYNVVYFGYKFRIILTVGRVVNELINDAVSVPKGDIYSTIFVTWRYSPVFYFGGSAIKTIKNGRYTVDAGIVDRFFDKAVKKECECHKHKINDDQSVDMPKSLKHLIALRRVAGEPLTAKSKR